jgi:hypothetical protein
MPFKVPANAALGLYRLRLTTVTSVGATERVLDFTVIR